ncbi:origin recognition complex subunit 2 isoform X2 [Hydra vulgaris]|uniref:origin recognition complex subunit 2 isoform X2 n=1 Tax=Hydra vulgaris TaxID=6087 RepID=UPI001F5EEC77|nr:origin recognition complex subunit 2 isoform X2 [Hydra vulgaris]
MENERVTTRHQAERKKVSGFKEECSERKSYLKEPIYKDESTDSDFEDEEKDCMIKARVLTENDLNGQDIFGFKTPKRKEALSKAAQNSVRSGKSIKSRKLTSSSKKNIKKNGKNVTPSLPCFSPKEELPEEKENGKENCKKVGRKIHLHAIINTDEDEFESETEDEEENEYLQGNSENNPADTDKARDILDLYFEVHNKKHISVTSDRTLSNLQKPKMPHEEFRKHLKETQASHINETVALFEQLTSHFQEWMFQLLCGFNVLLYGLGSKYNLIRQFKENFLSDAICLVVNGFFPGITIKQILNTITEDLLEKDIRFKSIIDHSVFVKKHFDSDKSNKLFVIIHNIDGAMLRSTNVQAALSHIASAKNVHLIASIDHINAPLIWDQSCLSLFNWVWYDATTFDSYDQETSYENSLLVQQSGTLALSSLAHVLRSLTPNARGIFKLLVNYQLDNKDSSSYQGLSINDLYSRCREMFLVNSDLTLKAQLTEFKDHKLIKLKKGSDGVEYLFVAVDESTLKEFLTNEEEYMK